MEDGGVASSMLCHLKAEVAQTLSGVAHLMAIAVSHRPHRPHKTGEDTQRLHSKKSYSKNALK